MNASLFNYIHNFSGRNPILDGVAIFFASYLVYFLVLGFIAVVLMEEGLRRKLYRFAEGALAVILSRGIVAEAFYFLYGHVRPFAAYGFAPLIPAAGPSFPSGHTVILFALGTAVWYASKKWGILYLLLSLAVGVARIYAGVHWPYDILGGVVIGIVCGIVVHALLKHSREKLYG